mgnify:CR=1 FL=1|tara:strand:- start:1624 stop:2394 length:771 start_codon:yes stop_codon:yes gene_type:complete
MDLLKTKDFIINWIEDYAQINHIQSLIIGVSGGIDSALTSTLCAMTKLNTIIVSIPIHQNKKELDNAQKHIKWLLKTYPNTKSTTIDLSKLNDQYTATIPNEYQSDMGLINSRARMRMMTLYQIASSTNGIVVGTGNQIEDFEIGFFTKYGDGGVDISPIADLKKSEVKKLAIYCGIISNIIKAPPTDGLWQDGRTDEDQIGATYEELEWAMNCKNSKNLAGRKKEVFNIYMKLKKRNHHKMIPVPVCKIPKKLRN